MMWFQLGVVYMFSSTVSRISHGRGSASASGGSGGGGGGGNRVRVRG